MSKRLVIVAVVIATLLGGLSYFQFVFKPQMIRTFLSQMTPPPVTVASEPCARRAMGRAAHLHRHTDRLGGRGH